jgi:hypothetical protein
VLRGTLRFEVYEMTVTNQAAAPWQSKILLGLLPLLCGLQLLSAIVVLPRALNGFADFRQIYSGAYMMRTGMGRELYHPSAQKQVQDATISPALNSLPVNHPSIEYLILSPLSYLPYRAAYLAWAALNIVALILCIRLLPIPYGWLKAALFAGFAPMSIAIIHGQDTIWFLLLLLIAFRCRREFNMGLILGCGAFRFHLLIPILLVYAIWRRWKVLSGASITAALVAVLSIALVGIAESLQYARTAAHSTDVAMMERTNLLAFLSRLVPSHSLAIMISAGLSIGALWLVSRTSPSLATAVLTVPILSYHLLAHDLVILLLPISLSIEMGWLQIVAGALSIFPPTAFLSTLPSFAMLVRKQNHSCSRPVSVDKSAFAQISVPSPADSEHLSQPAS